MADINSQFSLTPNIVGKIQRSRFSMPSNVKLSCNVGQLIPFDVVEILPGDNITRQTDSLIRLSTLITPMMDDLFIDTWYFFVPSRLVWDHWQEFCGENKKSAWTQETVYTIPQLSVSGSADIYNYSVADYMGIPKVGDSEKISVNALPFRAYGLIYNEWFRDENLQDPVLVPTDDSTYQMSDTIGYNGKPFIAGKYHDYFTSCLPSPQKGPDVSMPMGSIAPVFGNGTALGLAYADNQLRGLALTGNDNKLNLATSAYGTAVDTTVTTQGTSSGVVSLGVIQKDWLSPDTYKNTGLYADLANASAPSINALRLAFATQQLYEIDSQGTRYTEILRNHFGVVSPDGRLQRPELLSYNHFRLNINQVVQNSESGTTPQGTTTAYSVTGNSDKSFNKSFVEHGYLIGICCARYKNSYQQGLNRMWSRRNRFDYYWPVFANIGNQPVLNKEIYAQGTAVDDEVFGYQEAWADYRYRPDRVAAEMRSSFPTSLDVWHLADNYVSLPLLSPEWIQVDKTNVDRVLAVQSKVSNQLIMDISITDDIVRPMPTYSVPGLLRM